MYYALLVSTYKNGKGKLYTLSTNSLMSTDSLMSTKERRREGRGGELQRIPSH